MQKLMSRENNMSYGIYLLSMEKIPNKTVNYLFLNLKLNKYESFI